MKKYVRNVDLYMKSNMFIRQRSWSILFKNIKNNIIDRVIGLDTTNEVFCIKPNIKKNRNLKIKNNWKFGKNRYNFKNYNKFKFKNKKLCNKGKKDKFFKEYNEFIEEEINEEKNKKN